MRGSLSRPEEMAVPASRARDVGFQVGLKVRHARGSRIMGAVGGKHCELEDQDSLRDRGTGRRRCSGPGAANPGADSRLRGAQQASVVHRPLQTGLRLTSGRAARLADRDSGRFTASSPRHGVRFLPTRDPPAASRSTTGCRADRAHRRCGRHRTGLQVP